MEKLEKFWSNIRADAKGKVVAEQLAAHLDGKEQNNLRMPKNMRKEEIEIKVMA